MEKKDNAGEVRFLDKWLLWTVLGIVGSILAVVLICSFCLNVFTGHGKQISVPDFTNMTVQSARAEAAASHIRVEVIDSVFIRRMGRGMVFSQNPHAGMKVKKGRLIRLIINANSPKKVQVPDLVGSSLRQAQAELQSKGLLLGQIKYVEDIATNNVLRQLYHGRDIKSGTKVGSGSQIDLVVGLNSEDAITVIPDVSGMKYMRAVTAIHDNSLNVGDLHFDKGIKTYSDSLDAVVYKQVPEPSDSSIVRMGGAVSLYLKAAPARK